ncbi:MAG: rhodanese-like domain-containing protein [Chitinophagaceae bacterium]
MKHPLIFKSIKIFNLLFFLLFLGIGATAQDSLNTKNHTYTQKKFERKMKKNNVQVLDVRTKAEFDEGRLPNATLMDVQKDDFKENIKSLDKEKTYLIYCRSGKRSEKALRLMYQAGFTNVYHLKGGYSGWKGEKIK